MTEGKEDPTVPERTTKGMSIATNTIITITTTIVTVNMTSEYWLS